MGVGCGAIDSLVTIEIEESSQVMVERELFWNHYWVIWDLNFVAWILQN